MKDLDYYRGLPYTAVAAEVADEEGDRIWRAALVEIPTVVGLGTTGEEALEDMRDRFEDYARWCLDHGLDIPEPKSG
jgi:predicted RNase H-like HicB family nuclease